MGVIGVSGKGVSSSASSIATSGMSTQVAGSGFLIGTCWYNGPASFSSISDNKGNTSVIAQIGAEQVGGLQSSRLFYIANGAGGSGHTFTLGLTAAAPCSIFVVEIKPSRGAGMALGEHAEGPNDTTSPYDSAALSLTGIGQLVLVFYADDSNTGTATHTVSGHTIITEEADALNFLTGCLAYRVAVATGSYSASMTQTGTINNSTPYVSAWYDKAGNTIASSLFPRPKLRIS